MRFAKQIVAAFILIISASAADPARIKDIAGLAGVRNNQLIGYGLVVGLDGTGDKTSQTPFTDRSFQNMLLEFGLHIPISKNDQLKNIAAVAISANLPPFGRIGQKIDVTISSLGNATSLRGGALLMAPLKGADGKVYAIAQGNVVISGFGAQGADGSKVIVNVLASGTIPNGATIEKTIETPFVQNGAIVFELIRPDFTTAERIEKAINREFGYKVAQALDASAVKVRFAQLDGYKGGFSRDGYKGDIPSEDKDTSRYVPYISRIENIVLQPAETRARVVVNARTGTIVVGNDVTIAPVAVSHGNLSVIVTERPYVSQPQGFSLGKTVTGKASDLNVSQQTGRAFVFSPGPSLNDLVSLINSVGVAPGDLISILEAIKSSGALNADLEVI
ncbi:MAG: flagellar basal body P-ring protein FlgI [Gammaproteobacteria bacterium]